MDMCHEVEELHGALKMPSGIIITYSLKLDARINPAGRQAGRKNPNTSFVEGGFL